MMARLRRGYRAIRAVKWLSPASFVLCAAVAAGVFVAVHLAGWRESTSILCGTLPSGRHAQVIQSFEALVYTLFYMAAVIVAPILTLAAAVFHGFVMWHRRRRSEDRCA